jgi:hypothetical protein
MSPASKHIGGEGAARNPQPTRRINQIVEDVLKVKNPKARQLKKGASDPLLVASEALKSVNEETTPQP